MLEVLLQYACLQKYYSSVYIKIAYGHFYTFIYTHNSFITFISL